LTSDSYPGDDRSTGRGRARPIGSGFTPVLVLSAVSTAAMLILALVYYSGSPARIASDYTSIASPANQALTAELAGYTHNRRHHLTAARSDLRREVKTVASFDDQLAEVSFPSAAAIPADALTKADQKLAKLIGLQARAPSLRKMRSFDHRAEAAAAAAKTQVARIRRGLGLPPSSGPLF
jgi:hypothetical protein